jgi:two-component system sensor histidine kinase BarA
MPQKNGIDTLIALRRSNNPNARIPALALTADILQQEERALFDAGANGLQLKPLNENELLANICKLLSIRPPTEVPVPSSQEGDVSVNLFRQEVRDLLKKARQAVADDDLAELREQVHQLLGIAGVFKLTTLEQLVRHLHEQIKAGSLTSVSALLDKIDREAEWIDL